MKPGRLERSKSRVKSDFVLVHRCRVTIGYLSGDVGEGQLTLHVWNSGKRLKPER